MPQRPGLARVSHPASTTATSDYADATDALSFASKPGRSCSIVSRIMTTSTSAYPCAMRLRARRPCGSQRHRLTQDLPGQARSKCSGGHDIDVGSEQLAQFDLESSE